jgi:hypothetical protein
LNKDIKDINEELIKENNKKAKEQEKAESLQGTLE